MNIDFDFLIDYRVGDTFAEVFWDMPLDATPGCSYLVVNNTTSESLTVKKTHVSLTDLTPDTDYKVDVYIIYHPEDSCINNCNKILLGNLTIHTTKTRKK